MKMALGKRTQMARTLFALATTIVLASSCATIIKGSDQSVSVNSDPTAARVVITDLNSGQEVHTGSTPLTASLKRGAGYFKSAKYKVSIEKPGYKNEEIVLEGTPGGWYIAGNLFFGGLIGYLAVDPSTGAMWTLEPEDISVTLKQEGTSLLQGESLIVLLKSSLPADLQGKLKPLKLLSSQE